MAAIFLTSASSCAALQDYSRRVGRNACRSAGTCTVYDQTGAHQEPCWPTQEGQMAYPGDADWPFEHGVCDTVEQMNAPWPELSGTAADASAEATADPHATAAVTSGGSMAAGVH
ncbi:MAG: hypothetical protein U0842_17390 [Candidatus Binatia bacterium]